MKALSIRQPWAWYIVHAGKDIENRTWRTNFRGRFLIHAAKGLTLDEFHAANDPLHHCDGPFYSPPGFDKMNCGGIVGYADLVDCVSESASPWFSGPFGFVLANVRFLPFTPYRGALQFFDVDVESLPRARLLTELLAEVPQ